MKLKKFWNSVLVISIMMPLHLSLAQKADPLFNCLSAMSDLPGFEKNPEVPFKKSLGDKISEIVASPEEDPVRHGLLLQKFTQGGVLIHAVRPGNKQGYYVIDQWGHVSFVTYDKAQSTTIQLQGTDYLFPYKKRGIADVAPHTAAVLNLKNMKAKSLRFPIPVSADQKASLHLKDAEPVRDQYFDRSLTQTLSMYFTDSLYSDGKHFFLNNGITDQKLIQSRKDALNSISKVCGSYLSAEAKKALAKVVQGLQGRSQTLTEEYEKLHFGH